jgi:ceramide glucosyltransferase
LPSTSFASRLRAAWDTSIATMMGEHDHNFAWGGSMAIRTADFKRLKVAEHYWKGTVSDDYAITRAVREAGGAIHFEPRCLVASRGDSTVTDFIKWANRQIIITRVYAPHFWRIGLASYGLYAVTIVWGVVLLAMPGITPAWKITAAALLAAIVTLGMIKGRMRAVIAQEIFSSETIEGKRTAACYWQFTPIIPWVMLFNFITAGFVRRIEWLGTVYELKSMHELRIIRRRDSAG